MVAGVRRATLITGLTIVAIATAWQAIGTAIIGALSTPAVSAVLSFIAFASAAVYCTAHALISGRGALIRGLLRAGTSLRLVIVQNIMTAGVFVCFYFCLAFVPATAASVIEAGIGPLVAALATVRLGRVGSARRFIFPLVTALIAAVIVVLSLEASSRHASTHFVGVLLAICAGLCGVGVVLCSMKLVERGFTATGINATRFHGAWIVSGVAVIAGGVPQEAVNLPLLLIVGVALGAAPLVVLQFGITRSQPLPTELVMSSLPALVFVSESIITQTFDGGTATWMLALLACSALAVFSEQRYAKQHYDPVPAELIP
ncbi:MAG: DMT family transporter [Microbacterium sp.]